MIHSLGCSPFGSGSSSTFMVSDFFQSLVILGFLWKFLSFQHPFGWKEEEPKKSPLDIFLAPTLHYLFNNLFQGKPSSTSNFSHCLSPVGHLESLKQGHT